LFQRNIFLRLVLQLLQFVIAIVVAKELGATENGNFSLFITEAAFFILLIGFSFESSVTYFLAKRKISVSNAISLIVILSILQVVVFFFVFLISKYLFNYTFFDTTDNNNFYKGLIFILGLNLSSSFSAILFAYKKFSEYFVGAVIIQFLVLSFILLNKYFLFYFNYNANNIITIFSLSAVLLAILSIGLVFFIFKNEIKNVFVIPKIGKEILTYTFLVFLGNLIQFLCYRVDVWFVNAYHTRQQVGLYAFANKIAQMWWVLPQIMAAIFFPLLALNEQNIQSFKRSIFYLLIISIITGVVAIILYPILIPFVTSVEYIQSYKAFALLLPGVIFFSVNILLASKFSADGNVMYNLRISTICLVIALILNWLLIPKYGIEGAAIASSIAYSFSSIFAIHKFVYGKKN
jgi:O-antigen/teichoic acid export membrane protein